MNLYDELGVTSDATAADIKRAHRKRVSKCHPDAGGDRAEFERVQSAYMVLIDPALRQRYDETGDTEIPAENPIAELAQLIMQAFDQVLGQAGGHFREQDLIAHTRAVLQRRKQDIVKARAKAKAERATQEELIARLKFGGDGPDVILGAIRQRIANYDAGIDRAERDEETTDRALAYLEAYGFEFDEPAPRSAEPELVVVTLEAAINGGNG